MSFDYFFCCFVLFCCVLIPCSEWLPMTCKTMLVQLQGSVTVMRGHSAACPALGSSMDLRWITVTRSWGFVPCWQQVSSASAAALAVLFPASFTVFFFGPASKRARLSSRKEQSYPPLQGRYQVSINTLFTAQLCLFHSVCSLKHYNHTERCPLLPAWLWWGRGRKGRRLEAMEVGGKYSGQ